MWLLVVQMLVGASLVAVMLGRRDPLARAYIGAWLVIGLVVAYRYGIDGQLAFYSNDQRYYVDVVESVVRHGVPYDVDWWLTASRWPYTLPAALLSLAGFSATVASKVVSLAYLLGCLRLVRNSIDLSTRRRLVVGLYVTALGAIGVFFSVLALRETAMMYLVLLLLLGKSPAARVSAAVLLFFLRQHLAIAIVLAILLSAIVGRRRSNGWTPLRAGLTILGGNVLGYLLFSLGFQYLLGTAGVFGHRFGIEPVLRISSNYLGLQFLTATEDSIEFSVSALLLSRLVFSETIVIPAIFTVLALVSRRFDPLGRCVLLAFSIYVGLVTNTDFNSFRQNIPMIPVMGLVVVRHLVTNRNLTADIVSGSRGR